MYHPSQDYNDDSQVDPEFRPTKRELKEADKEGRGQLVSEGSGKKLSNCTYVNMLISVHMSSFLRNTQEIYFISKNIVFDHLLMTFTSANCIH